MQIGILRTGAPPRHAPSESRNLKTDTPKNLLYATSAAIGGTGLGLTASETLKLAWREKFLGRAIGFDNRQREIPAQFVCSLRWHPVRLLSFLPRPNYYGAKRQYADRIAARELKTGRYDVFHGWSGDALRALRVARERGVPSLLEIPTCHRNKGIRKPAVTKSERERDAARFPKSWLNRLLITRQRVMEEYQLADLILLQSEYAAETFLVEGFPPEKLFHVGRGVNVERFRPGNSPPIFRAVFVGALIRRKGVHLLLEAWHRLRLKDAELVLVGAVHDEMKPALQKYRLPNVRLAGFVANVEDFYREASLQVYASRCEGSAKATYEAAASGLAQINTREAGEVVVDGFTGLTVPCENVDALAAALQRLYDDRALLAQMGRAARQRAVENFSWDHFRQRVRAAYAAAMARARR